jgi:hypothetical protein
MDRQVAMYLIYLVICIPMTIYVGTTLFRNGRVFLNDVFEGREELADAVNHLLIVGFYLLTIGFVVATVSLGGNPEDAGDMMQALSVQVGAVMVTLGAVHLFNLRMLSTVRRKFPGASATAKAVGTAVTPHGPRSSDAGL